MVYIRDELENGTRIRDLYPLAYVNRVVDDYTSDPGKGIALDSRIRKTFNTALAEIV